VASEGPCGAFVEIPGEFLAEIATDSDRIPKAYFTISSAIGRVFWMRLRFLHRMAGRFAPRRDRCLDFGAGGGVFLPTLAGSFARVVAVDLETLEARRVIERFGLENVTLVQGDVADVELADAPFDAIFAADVLEHFRQLDTPLRRLHEWLADDGVLFTSLPTENLLYVALRLVFGIEKPVDHYHTGHEVERALARAGFVRTKRWYVPLRLRIAPLYLISAWRKGAD